MFGFTSLKTLCCNSRLDEQRMTLQFWKLLSLHTRQVAFPSPSGLGRTSVCSRGPPLHAIIAADKSTSHCIQEVNSPSTNFTKLPNVPFVHLALLLPIREVPGSNISSETGYADLVVSWFFSVPPGIYQYDTLNWVMTTSFHILSNSLLPDHFIIRYLHAFLIYTVPCVLHATPILFSFI
jgi:hypothetical protein